VIRWLVRLATVIGMMFLLVTLTPIDYWWATALAGPWDDPKGDVLVVLTGSLLDERTIGMSSYWRAVYAVRTFLDDRFQEMIISGGAQGQTVANAIPMRDFVVSQGVPAQSVQLETVSLSTHESAVQVAKMLGAKTEYGKLRVVLLTSDYHMFRSYRAFRRAGAAVFPRPIPDARKRVGSFSERWGVFLELVGESTKIAYYWSRGWI
jgi:uncharacterized SAM-binding protein YcdF (DUF218 family)